MKMKEITLIKKIKMIVKKIFPYIAIVISAFLFSYAIRAFINKAGLLTGGLSGITLLISRYIAMLYYQTDLASLLDNETQMILVNTLTSVLYFVINLPLIVLAFKKLGKRFAILSSIYIISITVFVRFLPNNIMNIFNLENDILSYAIFAGVMAGGAISLTLNVGGSSGGLEIVATYFSRKKQISIGKFTIIVNALIIALGGILMGEWTPMLFTLVYIFVSGWIVDTLHRFTKKMIIHVITSEYINISSEISKQTNYNSTAWKALGGYTGAEKYDVMIVVPERKVEQIIEIIQKIDSTAFIVTMETTKVYGNFYIEPLK